MIRCAQRCKRLISEPVECTLASIIDSQRCVPLNFVRALHWQAAALQWKSRQQQCNMISGLFRSAQWQLPARSAAGHVTARRFARAKQVKKGSAPAEQAWDGRRRRSTCTAHKERCRTRKTAPLGRMDN